jgi:hypothetical protein
MFAKWLEEYERLSKATRFISKLGTFLVSLFAFLSCWQIFNALSYNPSAAGSLWNNILVSIIFHLIIGIIFAIKFALLFFNSKRIFWLAQMFWLTGLLSIIGFVAATRFTLYGSLFKPSSSIDFGMDNYPIFLLYTSYSFEFFVFLYLFASQIRQIITAVLAFIKSK